MTTEKTLNIKPCTLNIKPCGGTEWACYLGERFLGSFEFGEISDDGQWEGDMDDLFDAARERFNVGADVPSGLAPF